MLRNIGCATARRSWPWLAVVALAVVLRAPAECYTAVMAILAAAAAGRPATTHHD
jgi:hypothetical protein